MNLVNALAGFPCCGWRWTADTKLVFSYLVGARTPPAAYDFIIDAASRVKFEDESNERAPRRRVQIMTDGLYWYVHAIEHAFGDVDYAVQQKHFGSAAADKSAETRYSPGRIANVETEVIKASPIQSTTVGSV